MKKIAVAVALLVTLVALAACSSSTQVPSQQDKEPESSERIVVVSSASPADVLPAFTTFTWNDGYHSVLSAVNEQQEEAVKGYIREQIIAYLQTKGYRYQSDPGQADVVFGFLVALEDAVADKIMLNRFGLPPAQNQGRSVRGYQEGTLLLTVLDTGLQKVYWRSAVLGLVDLEKEQQDIYSDRMQRILEIMLGGFPKAGR